MIKKVLPNKTHVWLLLKQILCLKKVFSSLLALVLLIQLSNAQTVSSGIDRVQGSPYPYSSIPDRLYLTSENYSYSEKISLQTLQGVIAKIKPEILRDLSGHRQIVEKAVIE